MRKVFYPFWNNIKYWHFLVWLQRKQLYLKCLYYTLKITYIGNKCEISKLTSTVKVPFLWKKCKVKIRWTLTALVSELFFVPDFSYDLFYVIKKNRSDHSEFSDWIHHNRFIIFYHTFKWFVRWCSESIGHFISVSEVLVRYQGCPSEVKSSAF